MEDLHLRTLPDAHTNPSGSPLPCSLLFLCIHTLRLHPQTCICDHTDPQCVPLIPPAASSNTLVVSRTSHTNSLGIEQPTPNCVNISVNRKLPSRRGGGISEFLIFVVTVVLNVWSNLPTKISKTKITPNHLLDYSGKNNWHPL